MALVPLCKGSTHGQRNIEKHRIATGAAAAAGKSPAPGHAYHDTDGEREGADNAGTGRAYWRWVRLPYDERAAADP